MTDFEIKVLVSKCENLKDKLSIAKKALSDIKNWSEELEDEWEDTGYRAAEALNEINNKP